jgi:hypothetical protein
MADAEQMNTAQLLMYAATEVNSTYQRIVGALKQFLETGDLPEPPTTPYSGGAGRKKKGKGTRKPSAFNNFVKEKIHELRGHRATEEDRSNNGAKYTWSTCNHLEGPLAWLH